MRPLRVHLRPEILRTMTKRSISAVYYYPDEVGIG